MASNEFGPPTRETGIMDRENADAAAHDKLNQRAQLKFEIDFLRVALKFCDNQPSLATSFARNITDGDTEELTKRIKTSIKAIEVKLGESDDTAEKS